MKVALKQIFRVFLVFTTAAAHATVTSESTKSTCPNSVASVLSNAQQLIVVTARTWNESAARMSWWQRASDSQWQPVLREIPAVIGKSGLAWGHEFAKLAPPWRRPSDPIKKEGDGRTPAGIHRLGMSFGFETPPGQRDFLTLTPQTVCVDDPQSRSYNLVVSSKDVQRDWQSAELMRKIEVYKLGLIVDYRSSAAHRAGSCIFIHIWKEPTHGTAGCLAAAEDIVTRLQGWVIDRTKAAIVFLPEETLVSTWTGCLPFLHSENRPIHLNPAVKAYAR
jgi:D-alanyl-D-alanine dipeptidase